MKKRWFEIQKIVFWLGVVVFIVGAVLCGYGFVTVRSLFEELRELYTHPFAAFPWPSFGSPFQVFEEQLFLAQLLQSLGVGMAVFGAIMLAYGLWVKKENR